MKKVILITVLLISAAASAFAIDVDCKPLAFDKTVTLCEAVSGETTVYSRHEVSAAGASIKTITQDEYLRILEEDSRAAEWAATHAKPEPTEAQKKAEALGSITGSHDILNMTPTMPQGPAPKATKESCKASGGKWSKGACKVKAAR